ncbi:acyl-CoA-binding domain-containing protein 5A isoform X2 [Syngnathus scovelli]|uniref:acyl-CoA-binding domain-containing protein 5A isoform X2 n=1 Tax=Syngnathus scovelli TaxID=161590 RepID=UPI0021103A09|nr:acyl-CoA-binding domain-containing protein 5A isoform X45 [Syngnathus scovelli]
MQGPFQLSDDMILTFYSYYKQATMGSCSFTRPTGFWESHEKNKWNAWNSLGNMTKEEAMKNYVENIQLILETMPVSNEVSDLVQQLGNFYLEEEEDGGGEDNEVNSRPFTRPFAKQAELLSPTKPALEGYGDLWGDIQNFQEEEQRAMGLNGAEGVKCKDDGQYPQKGEMTWSPEPRLRCSTRSSSSSVEASVSSLTHSSLNSDVEEEELAYAKEHSTTCSPTYMNYNEQQTDAVKKNYHLADSDDEEFCDSMDHPAMEKILSTSQIRSGGSTSALEKEQELWFESSSDLKAEDYLLRVDSYGKDTHTFLRDSQSPKTACSSQLRLPTRDNVSHCTRPSTTSWGNVNEQIFTALLRLQDDMTDVLHRLRTLEELTVEQSRSSLARCADALPVARKFLTPFWWPFDHSPITMVMTALWPAIAYGLVQLYSRRKRRGIV